MAELAAETDGRGHRLVVRNGRHRPRTVATADGPVEVTAPRVNDRRVDEATGERKRFSSKILAPWCRRSPKVSEVLPLLYLHGLSSGDSVPALEQFLGSAAGLSPATVTRLTKQWGDDHTVVRDQLGALVDALKTSHRPGVLCEAAVDLFQLSGELAFDSNRYTDAAAAYTLAASATSNARSYDLWACALVRHAYVGVYGRRYREAAEILEVARRVALRGDSALSTRHWVAAVQAEAYAGLGDFDACERALDEALLVVDLGDGAHNGGWLRFDGSRLAEERGARYVQLGRLDLAETALKSALESADLTQGQSFRRRGAVLVDLASIGARRHDAEQVAVYGTEALQLARQSGSGYVAHRLQALHADLTDLGRDRRVADLRAEISDLCTT
ncbi:transposase [Streptomyces sp. NBC_00102]|uniref:transposase n=1 Tax=Streptomyces sp. NBC_00102 TaxID=2975652 RepID=UPI002250642F|nr:transposase [Streptomyces sp. NBC_00102]MCX5402386.1 transposase [Streptomyces sp. NBC_00102]